MVVYLLKLTFVGSVNQYLIVNTLTTVILGLFIFFSFISLTTLYYLMDLHSYFYFYQPQTFSYIHIFDYSPQLFFLNPSYIGLHFITIYTFPYIYIFILITILSILFCLAYNIHEVSSFMFYSLIILLSGYTLFFTSSLILFFFAYEMLLIPSFFILYNFAKTRRCVEAAYLMFFWTQFGALFLIFSFIYIFFITGTSSFFSISEFYFTTYELNFIFFCLLMGFGVKLPIWPFYGWLPKAHVEASTNFSIFLSGVLVKFAFFGFFKCLLTIQLEPTFFYVYPFLTVGITDAIFKLFYQIDLKKLVAYSTVVEMH